MQLELSGVEVRGESWIERCACTIENASAYVVTVITVLERHSLSMVSADVADLSGQTAVTHMRMAPGRRQASSSRCSGDSPGCQIRGVPAGSAAELRALVKELLEETVVVDIPEASLEHASTVWASLPQPERPIARGRVRAPAAATGDGTGPPQAWRSAAARSGRSWWRRRSW